MSSFYITLIYITIFVIGSEALLHPASSSIALIASISVPITELLPERSFFIDWCFQMSYDLPHSLSSFYNTPIWPDRKKSKHQKRETNVMNQTLWDKYNTITFAKRHPSDFTIEELYQGIENILESYGYDASCLLLSICELARHPFADDHINILTSILTFILSPSLHGDFDHYKQLNYEIYKAAELNGFLDRNCSNIYFECNYNLLSSATKIIFFN